MTKKVDPFWEAVERLSYWDREVQRLRDAESILAGFGDVRKRLRESLENRATAKKKLAHFHPTAVGRRRALAEQ